MIGGGLLGLEAAYALAAQGCRDDGRAPARPADGAPARRRRGGAAGARDAARSTSTSRSSTTRSDHRRRPAAPAACASPTARELPATSSSSRSGSGRRSSSPARSGSTSTAASSSTTLVHTHCRACSRSASAPSTAASSTASSRRSTTRRAVAAATLTGAARRAYARLGAEREAQGDGRRPRQRRRRRRRREAVVTDARDGHLPQARRCATGRAAGAVLLGDTRGSELLLDAVRRAAPRRRPAAAARRRLAGRRRRPARRRPDLRLQRRLQGRDRRRHPPRAGCATPGGHGGHARRHRLRLVQAASSRSSWRSRATAPSDEPAYLCPCRKQTREQLAARVRAEELRVRQRGRRALRHRARVRRLQAGARLPRLGGLRQPPPRGARRALHQRPRPREHPERRHVLASSRGCTAA